MTDIIDTVQLLDTGEALVELFDITLPNYENNEEAGNYHLFNGEKDGPTQVSFNQVEYLAIPIQITGIEVASSGALARPTLTVANIPSLTGGVSNSETTLDLIRRGGIRINISGATQADPVVITTSENHTLITGDKIEITGIAGMTELNNQTFYVNRLSATTVELFTTSDLSTSEDGTSHTAYTSGGTLTTQGGPLDVNFERNEDLIGTKVTYRQTFASKLNKAGTSETEFPPQIYYIDRIASENNIFATFELASPLDLEKAKIPARSIIGQYCNWRYQGVIEGFGGGCSWSYNGDQHRFFRDDDTALPDISTINTWLVGNSYNAGDLVQTVDGTTNQIQIWEAVFANSGKDPLYFRKYWKRVDLCGKTLSSCKIRFQGYSKTVSSITALSTDAVITFATEPRFSVGESVRVVFNPGSHAFASDFGESYHTISAVDYSNPYTITLPVDISGTDGSATYTAYVDKELNQVYPLPFGGFPGSRKFR